MKLTVTLAQTDTERLEAFSLVKQIYAHEFNIDLDLLKEVSTLSFQSETILVRNESQKLVGTASVMFPFDGLFPSEYLFGADIKGSAARLPLANTVEIGRLAKENGKDGDLVVKAIMLATSAYLKKRSVAGWIATVKPEMSRLLKIMRLKMHYFEPLATNESARVQKEILDGYTKKNVIDGYKGDNIDFFWASAATTFQAFDRMQALIDEGLIRIDL